MQRSDRARTAHRAGWIAGSAIGAVVVAAVVGLVSTIVAYAQLIGDEAAEINAALKEAERNTAPLGALSTTVEDATAIVGGLQRGRARLGG